MSNSQRPDLASQSAPAGNNTQNDPSFEQRVVALQRKERELAKKEQSLNGAMTLDQIKDYAKKDKAGFFKSLGIELPVDPNEDVPDHIREFKELKSQIEAERADKARQEYRESILGKVKSDDKYELINSLGAYDSVFDQIEGMKASGEEFDPYSVFEQAEQATWEQLERVKSSKKLQSWFAPPTPPQGQNEQRGYQKHPMDVSRSVTNSDRGTGSNTEAASNRPLSKEESIRVLAQKYGNQNKQG